MKQKMIKNIMIFFLFLLPIHYALIGVLSVVKSEPWPAFVLPAFKSVYSTDDGIAVDYMQLIAENTTSGRSMKVKPKELFRGVKGSLRQGIYRTHFSDSVSVASFGGQTRSWLKQKIDRQHPALDANRLQIRWIKKIVKPSAGSAYFTTKVTNQFSMAL